MGIEPTSAVFTSAAENNLEVRVFPGFLPSTLRATGASRIRRYKLLALWVMASSRS
jgi:hypothetical protein